MRKTPRASKYDTHDARHTHTENIAQEAAVDIFGLEDEPGIPKARASCSHSSRGPRCSRHSGAPCTFRLARGPEPASQGKLRMPEISRQPSNDRPIRMSIWSLLVLLGGQPERTSETMGVPQHNPWVCCNAWPRNEVAATHGVAATQAAAGAHDIAATRRIAAKHGTAGKGSLGARGLAGAHDFATSTAIAAAQGIAVRCVSL